MKRPKLTASNIIYIVYYLVIVIAVLSAIAIRGINISTDFMALLPSNGIPEGYAKAEAAIASRQNSTVNIFVSHEDFPTARKSAVNLISDLVDTGIFADISSGDHVFDPAPLFSLLEEHHYQLLDDKTIEMIRTNPESFLQNSLGRIFSAFSLSSFENIDKDPFLLDELIVSDILDKAASLTSFMPKDGVLAAEMDGAWYILIQGQLTQDSLDISDAEGSGIGKIYNIGDSLESETSGLSVYYSGFPFHSYESASSAQHEISIITTVSIALIIVMFLILFRNIYVIELFLVSTFSSLLSAAAALVIFFPEIHVMTLIFGTTLIGTSIDYAIHFYVAYASRNKGEDGYDVSRTLGKNLFTSFFSTILCYALIIFSPYSILAQVAVFSSFGLLGSYLTVKGLFPLLIRPKMISQDALAFRLPPVKIHKSYLPHLFIVSLVIFVVSLPKLSIHNDLSRFYSMSDRLLESEMTAGKIMGFTTASYSIVEGDSEDDARNKEAIYSAQLERAKEKGIISGYLSPSVFIPSPAEQINSKEASRMLLPYIEEICTMLGITADDAVKAIAGDAGTVDFEDLPAGISGMLSQLVPGDINGKYYIAVMLFGVKDGNAMRSLAADCDGVFYFQKSVDISHQLDMLTGSILAIFAVACVLIVLLVLIGYRKRGLMYSLSPLIVVLLTIGTVVLLGMEIDFFFAVGLLLVIGLGLDYMVFAGAPGKKPMLAITLSYATTALSFGSLLFSSFVPVHIFGLTVFIGITAAYIASLASSSQDRS